jgi:multidrug resistance protein
VHRSAGDRSERRPLPQGFFTIWSTVAIDLIGFGIVLPILPQYAERFGATPTVTGLLVASFSVAQLVCAPIWGRLSDRIGRRPILVVSLFGTAVGSLLTGLAGGIALLFIGRIIDGASGASVSVAQAAANDLATPRDRARLMGLLGAAFGVGFVLGPALGALGSTFGPEVPFYIAAGIAFVNALVALVRLPETKGRARAADDVPFDRAESDGAMLAGLAEIDGPGLVEPAHHGPPGGSAPAVAARGAADEAGGVVVVPAVDRRKDIIRMITVSFVAMIAFSGFEATFALLGDRRLGLDQRSTGIVFAVIGLGLVGVQGGLVGRVVGTLHEARTMRLALVANAVGLFLLAIDGRWLTMGPALLLLIVGQGLLTPTMSSRVAGLAGRSAGRWLGWQQSAGGLARVIGPITAGLLFEHVGIGAPYLIGVVLVLLALTLVPSAR